MAYIGFQGYQGIRRLWYNKTLGNSHSYNKWTGISYFHDHVLISWHGVLWVCFCVANERGWKAGFSRLKDGYVKNEGLRHAYSEERINAKNHKTEYMNRKSWTTNATNEQGKWSWDVGTYKVLQRIMRYLQKLKKLKWIWWCSAKLGNQENVTENKLYTFL